MTTLKVTVGEADRIRSTARERIRAAERDEPLDDDEPVLNFESYATLAKFLRETNLELLETIRQEEPPQYQRSRVARRPRLSRGPSKPFG